MAVGSTDLFATPDTDNAAFGTGRVTPDFARRLERERNQLRAALEHIVEYWNRDENEKAMSDALWHILETAEDALANNSSETPGHE